MNPAESTFIAPNFHASMTTRVLRDMDLAHASPPMAAALHWVPGDAAFIELQNAFRPAGGLARGDEVALRLHVDGHGGHARLARWIVGRQVFSFEWHGEFWLPMFQFEGPDLCVHPGLRPVLGELATVMDGWTLAMWFAQPNPDLHGFSPAQAWRQNSHEVFQAARLQRFVIKG